jgi:PAS domain S-box-containing protein
MRFRTKTILGVALIEMALLAVLVGSALSVLRDSNETELTRRVQLGGKLLAVAAKDAVISQDLATLDSLVDEAMASGQIDYVRILDAGGAVLSEQGDAKILSRHFLPDTRINQVADDIFDWSAPVLVGGVLYGEVRLGISTDPLNVLLASARHWAAGIAGLEMLLVAVFSWLLGSYLARQLVALRKASDRFVAGDFGHRVPVQGNDELAETARAFNRLAEQLAESNDRVHAENLKRLEAQQEAEKSGNLLREAVSSIAQGFTIYDQEDRLVHCNEAYRGFYEASRDLIVPGNTFEKIVRTGAERGQYSEAIGQVDAWVRQRVATHQKANGEVIEQRLADGRWLLIVEHRTPSGYIVGNRIDITELKTATEALAASEQRWHLAVSGANDGIWDWNLQSGTVYFSERWKSMLGCSDEEIGNTVEEWSARVHPDDLEQTLAEVQRHLRGETDFYEWEHRLRCKDGNYKWVLDRGRAQFDVNGKPVRMAGSHTDITERRAAEAVIRDRTEQLNAIFDLSPDGFLSFDAAHRVKYVSPAFTRLTGLGEEAMIGLDESSFSERLANICIPQARFSGIESLSSMSKALCSDIPGNGTNVQAQERRQTIELADAGKRVLQVGLRLSQAETVSQILYLRDITHETEVDRLKSEFLSTAAHELRTPMASIYGFTELLMTQEFDATDRADFHSTIFRQSELMISIINELLDLSRIEARRGKDFSIARINVVDLLREIVSGFKASDGRVSAVLQHAAGPLWVRADLNKLTQAISNVLSNAYKYSPDGGEVGIGLIESPGDGDVPARIGIRITDHGIGMTEEQRARVCERFYRADTSGKIPGTGLGMSIVKEIVELHGGELEITSEVGTGSTVTIWLPDIAAAVLTQVPDVLPILQKEQQI